VAAVLTTLVSNYLLCFVVGRILLRLTPSASALFALGASFPSGSFFGTGVLGGFFGRSSAVAIASVAIIGNLLLVPVSVVVLEATGGGRQSGAKPALGTVIINGLLHAVKQPYVWAPLAGLVLVLMGFPVPSLIKSMLNLIGQTTSGVALFVGGLTLAAHSLKVNGVIAVNAMLKSVIQPGLMLGLVLLIGVRNPLGREAVIAAALPSSVIATLFAGRYKTYQSEAGSTMVLTVVLLVIIVPLFLLLTG
jgi:malonate transporter